MEVVDHEQDGSREPPEALDQVLGELPPPPDGGGTSVARGSPDSIAPESRSASMTMLQNRVAPDSSRSTATQAGAPGGHASRGHDASSVVLPRCTRPPVLAIRLRDCPRPSRRGPTLPIQ